MKISDSLLNKNHQLVTFGDKAQQEMLKGAEILYNAVKSTMGPSGHNVAIDNGINPPFITKDGVTVAKNINLKDKLPSVGAELIKEVASKTNEAAGDGPQPLYAKVLTPNGWTTMGELKVGDSICGTNGTIQKVLGIFPKGTKEIYKVILSDGNRKTHSRIVECCEDHLWSVNTQRGNERLITTKQMFDTGLCTEPSERGRYFIKPTTVEFVHNLENIILDPYFLGVLLGDGSLSEKHEIDISVGLKEEYILDKLVLPQGCKLRKRYYTSTKHYIKATVTGSERVGQQRIGQKSIIKNALKELGLLGTTSHTKFIPKQYLFSSFATRQKLLDGLIDTDGSISKRGKFQYSTVSEQLCSDVVELCRSLGKVVYVTRHIRKSKDGSYSANPIYRISELKGNKNGMRIVDIINTNKKTEMMCIKVSNPDCLYITDNYVPTHNTTTGSVLAYNLFFNGYKMAATGRNTIALKRGIDWACSQVLNTLKQNSIPVRNDEDIISVGTISANGDREIGELLCQAIKKVGEDGIVTVEKAKSVHTTLDIIEGLSLETGYTSPYFVTNQEKLTSELQNPLILVTNKKLTTKEHILPVLQIAHEQERNLLVIADEIDQEALHVLLTNKMHGTVISCAVKAPSYGENRTDILQDICLVTGATCFDASQSTSLEKLTEDHLGTCEKVIISKHQTTIVGLGDPQYKELVDRKIEELRSILSNPAISIDELKRNNTKKRLAKLSGGIAVINVGGSTEVEIIEKKDRVDDALNATQAAVQEGILPGGGTALFYCAQELNNIISANPDNLSEDELFGAKIVYETCKAPLKVIVENTGRSYDVVSNKLTETSNGNFRWGYDAYNHRYCDLIDVGIIDPFKVERLALSHACSVVGLLLTTNCVITTQEESDEE